MKFCALHLLQMNVLVKSVLLGLHQLLLEVKTLVFLLSSEQSLLDVEHEQLLSQPSFSDNLLLPIQTHKKGN